MLLFPSVFFNTDSPYEYRIRGVSGGTSYEVNELPGLLATLHSNKASLYRQTYLAINLKLLTLVRTSERIEARWTEIDFENSM